MGIEKICEVCYKPFIAKRPHTKCCSDDCRKIRMKKYYEDKKAKRNTTAELDRLLIEARKHNMSYGKYVAMKEYKKVTGGR